MAVNEISSALLKRMFLAGVVELEANKEWINELNVFPVPDGDTGTNMTLTILSAAREVNALAETPDMKDLAKAISSGSLRGARGNSGVILSQLFRGFTKEIRQYDVLDIPILSAALVRATETAYKAVMKPKEGTILTVARGISDKSVDLAAQDIDLESFIRQLIEEGDRQLARTPDLLPVLKEAGVVDSGGQGLMQFLKGVLDGYLGKEVSLDLVKEGQSEREEVIKGVYCVSFTVKPEKPFSPLDEKELCDYLRTIADEVDCSVELGNVYIHLHTDNPGLAIEKGLSAGILVGVSVSNRKEEGPCSYAKPERTAAPAEEAVSLEQTDNAVSLENPVVSPVMAEKQFGFIVVSAGEGLCKIFTDLGADYIIEGGQTMNPSTQDMLNAVQQIPAKVIYILPNNKNIILAANQASILAEGKEVHVIPTKTIPQGIAALISFNGEISASENTEAMMQAIELVKTGMVTYATRDTVIDGIEIHKEDYIGLGDDGILADGTDVYLVTENTVGSMIDDSSELVSIYYGQDVNEEAAENMAKRLSEKFPSIDIEINEGSQPLYYYIISVE